MELIYLIGISLILVLVPIFRMFELYGGEDAKTYLFIVMTGIVFIIALFLQFPIPDTLASSALFLFICYLSISSLWSDNVQDSINDLPMWWALFFFYMVCHCVPRNMLLLAIFVPALFVVTYGFSQYFTGYDIFLPISKDFHFRSWFHNQNYVGSYLIVVFFISLYFAANVSLWFLVSTFYIGLGIYLTRARGSWLAVIAGFAFLIPWYGVVGLLVVTAFWGFYKKSRGGLKARWWLNQVCLEMFKKKPLFGWGARGFRRNLYTIQADMNKKKPEILGTINKVGKYPHSRGKRTHNDHIETLVDVGLLGCIPYALFFGTVIYSAMAEPILAGALLAVTVNALFFYPFRAAAPSLPFFALAGTFGSVQFINISLWYAIPIAFIAGYIIYKHAIMKFIGTLYYNKARNQKEIMGASKYVLKALKCDSDNNEYQVYAADMFRDTIPALSLELMGKAINNFSGMHAQWDLYLHYGIIAQKNKAYALAANSYAHSMYLDPAWIDTYNAIQNLKKELKNANN